MGGLEVTGWARGTPTAVVLMCGVPTPFQQVRQRGSSMDAGIQTEDWTLELGRPPVLGHVQRNPMLETEMDGFTKGGPSLPHDGPPVVCLVKGSGKGKGKEEEEVEEEEKKAEAIVPLQSNTSATDALMCSVKLVIVFLQVRRPTSGSGLRHSRSLQGWRRPPTATLSDPSFVSILDMQIISDLTSSLSLSFPTNYTTMTSSTSMLNLDPSDVSVRLAPGARTRLVSYTAQRHQGHACKPGAEVDGRCSGRTTPGPHRPLLVHKQ